MLCTLVSSLSILCLNTSRFSIMSFTEIKYSGKYQCVNVFFLLLLLLILLLLLLIFLNNYQKRY